jgi:hypothetical protein
MRRDGPCVPARRRCIVGPREERGMRRRETPRNRSYFTTISVRAMVPLRVSILIRYIPAGSFDASKRTACSPELRPRMKNGDGSAYTGA